MLQKWFYFADLFPKKSFFLSMQKSLFWCLMFLWKSLHIDIQLFQTEQYLFETDDFVLIFIIEGIIHFYSHLNGSLLKVTVDKLLLVVYIKYCTSNFKIKQNNVSNIYTTNQFITKCKTVCMFINIVWTAFSLFNDMCPYC